MKKLWFVGLFCSGLLLLPNTLAQTNCVSKSALVLGTEEVQGAEGATACFAFTVTEGTTLLTVRLEALSGEFDLFLTSQDTSVLSDESDKISFLPVTSAEATATFAFPEPASGLYTLGVKPLGGEPSEFRLSAQTSTLLPAEMPPSDEGSTVLFSTFVENDVPIGSDFGARVVYPLTINCPGDIQASATWEGTAGALALILNGPGQVGYFARVDGAKPLVLRYSISADDLARGGRWQLSLVNFSGGTAEGAVLVSTPHSNCIAPRIKLSTLFRAPATASDLTLTTPRLESASPHSVSNLRFNVAEGSRLRFGEEVWVTFEYRTPESDGVSILVHPFSNGATLPNYATSDSPLYPAGQGQGRAGFTVGTGVAVAVDQLRLQIYDTDQSTLLYERFVPVDFQFWRGE